MSSPRIGFAISTKERTQLTEKILPGLDCGGFDLIWCDGSKTPEGRAFASARHFSKTPLKEVHFDVTGGPDAAIQFSLKRLLARGYDYVGLIENDIELKPGWLTAMQAAWAAAEKDGFKVGGVTARSAASRVLTRTPNYAVIWNMGAGMALFSRAGAEAVLADYQLASAKKIHEFYQAKIGVDLAGVWELFMDQPDRGLGADWHFAPSMLKRGLVALGVMPNYAENIDVDFEEVCGTRFLRSMEQALPAHCLAPEELRARLNAKSLPQAHRASGGKPKVAEELAKNKDLTSVQKDSEFEHILRGIIRQAKPRFIVETGTYLGQGTTRIISSALKENGLANAKFYSVECNPEHHRQALANLDRSGLLPFVKPLLGVSVPRSLLPDAAAIRQTTIENVGGDTFVDHHEEKRIELYLNETNYPNLAEDLLGRCLRECEGKPDLLLLDSAGHMGNVEFNYVLTLLRAPCYIALDDIRHVKHARSVEQMKADPRFEMLAVTEEKFGSCLARFTPAAADLPADETARILFVRTDAIGDAVLASAMLEPLRKQYPQAKLAVLCQQQVAELFTACPLVDSIICYDRKKMNVPAERAQIISEIAAYQPDLILNAVRSRDQLSDELTLAFDGARRIGIAGDLNNISGADRESADARYDVLVPVANSNQTELALHGDFLRGLGIRCQPLQPVVWTSPDDEALADTFFQQEKLEPARTLALCPFTQHAIKDYPGFAAALKDFAGWNILLLGGPETRERCEQLAGELPGNVLNLAGRTTLREMAALIRRCKILVGSDTCAPHIACAVGVSNVVLLGGGHFGRFLPYSPLTTVVSLPLDCYGCNWQCQFASAHCLTHLAPEAVAAAIQSALKGSSLKPRLFAQTERQETSLPPVMAARLNPDEIDFTPVVINRPLVLAWPSLDYSTGAYKDEGDFRWLDIDATLQATVPEGAQPVTLSFELRAGEMPWYAQPLLHIQIYLNERTREHFIFRANHQSVQVRIPLAPSAQPYQVRITTDQFFTAGNPPRRLAIQLRQVQLTEVKAPAKPAKQLANAEAVLQQAAIQCNLAGRLDYDKLKALYPAFEEALDAWITPRLGFSIQPNPFDTPFPLVEKRFEEQLGAMRQHAAEVVPFMSSPKLAAIPTDKVDEVTPYWSNDYFHPGDAKLAYAMVARYRPKRIIECGCGNSTKFMRRAATDYQTGTQIICIDPEPRANIRGVADEFHQASATTIEPAFFDQLESGDFLFIDGSHLVMNGSDCVHLFLNVLPRLRPGVWVHVHDVFLPHDYPYDLHVSCRYNEQYMLAQLFLYSQEWQPALPVYYAHKKGILPCGGGSFWMRKLGFPAEIKAPAITLNSLSRIATASPAFSHAVPASNKFPAIKFSL